MLPKLKELKIALLKNGTSGTRPHRKPLELLFDEWIPDIDSDTIHADITGSLNTVTDLALLGCNLPLLSYFEWCGLEALNVDLRHRDFGANVIITQTRFHPPGHVDTRKRLTIHSFWSAVQLPRAVVLLLSVLVEQLLKTLFGPGRGGPEIQDLHFHLSSCEDPGSTRHGYSDILLATLEPVHTTLERLCVDLSGPHEDPSTPPVYWAIRKIPAATMLDQWI